MANVNPYLIFKGNTEEVFDFYKSVFGGEFVIFQRFKDTPEADKVPEEAKEKIMHVSLAIGEAQVLMGSDAIGERAEHCVQGTNISLSVGATTEEETSKIFNGLAAGGKVTMPLQKTFWGAFFGMTTDKFGVQWMVSCDDKQ